MTCQLNQAPGACLFCDLGNSDTIINYGIKDVFETIEGYLKSDLKIRHILVGGGSSIREGSWDHILKVIHFIYLLEPTDKIQIQLFLIKI